MGKMFECLYTPRCIVRLNSTSWNKNGMKRFQQKSYISNNFKLDSRYDDLRKESINSE